MGTNHSGLERVKFKCNAEYTGVEGVGIGLKNLRMPPPLLDVYELLLSDWISSINADQMGTES